jgi:biopolymer transport protein ExbD
MRQLLDYPCITLKQQPMALKRRNKVEPEFSLAAMIDVIFLLLMFFMLTSKFVTPNALNLQLPSSSSSSDVAKPSLTVSVNPKGEYYLNSVKMDKTRLMSSVESRVRATGKPFPETTININPEPGALVEDVVFIMNIAYKLKLKTVLTD